MHMISPNSNTVMGLAPINPEWIQSGKPIARCRVLANSSGTSSGYWDCTAGRFLWHYRVNETVLFLDGAVTLRDLANPQLGVHCGVGSSMMFPAGSIIEWTVPHYVRKFYVESGARASLLRRLYHKLRRPAGPAALGSLA
jgi:uncharacterized protein